MTVKLKVQQLPHAENLQLPSYQSEGASGLDLVAALPIDDLISLEPGESTLVPTGLAVEIPNGYEAQVRPRSGLASKHGITVLNSPGTIDSDYRGEIKVLLVNFGQENFDVKRGMRIAQLVIAPVIVAQIELVESVVDSARGKCGFGSTGI